MSTIKFISNAKGGSNVKKAAAAEKEEASFAALSMDALTLNDIDWTDAHACQTACLSTLKSDTTDLDAALKVASIVQNSTSQLLASGLIDEFRTILSSKGSPPSQRARVLLSLAQIAVISKEASEPYLLEFLPTILECAVDKNTSEYATFATHTIIKNAHALSAGVILPHLFNGMGSTGKYQRRLLALDLINLLAKVSASSVRQNLSQILPKVSECVTDINPQVTAAAKTTLNILAKTINNKDLFKALPLIVDATADYNLVPDCVKVLHATTFVRDIESAALSLIIPILSRALLERSSAALYRQAAVVVDNMCKLIPSPQDVTHFLSKLVPGLERIIETGADPDLREITKNTLQTVNKLLEDSNAALKSEKRVQVWAMRFLLKSTLDGLPDVITNHVSEVMAQLTNNHNFDPEEWNALTNYFKHINLALDSEDMRQKCFKMVKLEKEDIREQDHEVLCDCVFNLGYGGMMLLKDAAMTLRRGSRYGIVGKNGCGKTTLLRAISNGQLEGFPSPDELKTVYVSHTFQGTDDDSSVLEMMKTTFPNESIDEIDRILTEFEFTSDLRSRKIPELSGGWKMKLELAIAMLRKADILLLDEPTNHLDAKNCMWLEKYLNGNMHITVILVSHDSGFLDSVCTHIIHYHEKRLQTHKCDFSKFVEIVPEAKSYLEYDAVDFAFNFPAPGNLDAVKSMNRTILRLKNVSFTYEGKDTPTLLDINIGVSLGSRVAIVGPNGAGKSTMIKIMTGELYPTVGKVQKHASLRLAYVAQHAFHHLEQHLEKSPNAYIRWRYENGIDKELLAKETRTMSVSEQAKKEEMNIECLCGRQKLKRSYRYEVKLVGHDYDDTVWVNRERLLELGFKALIEAYDDFEAARGGNYEREITTQSIEQHLVEFGLIPEVGTHGQIKGLSGGQKVKVVLAAAMWLKPHILVMDEPTNYLDQQSLLALARAIKEYKGGIVIISHNSKFVSSVCDEMWEMKGGRLFRKNSDGEPLPDAAEEDESHFVEDKPKGERASDENEDEPPAEAEGKKKKEKKVPGKKKETRKERIMKEKIKLAKLYKYGPKADGTEYSSDEEHEDNVQVGNHVN